MSEIISEMFTKPVQAIIACCLILVILLWLLSIVWVNRDAKQRGTSRILWTIVAIVPFAGMIAYCLLRPQLTQIDEDEQLMELDLIQRQLDAYGNCPQCGYPIESDYIVCPKCRKQLRTRCSSCGRPLKKEWVACPYCAQPVEAGGARRGAASNRNVGTHGAHSSAASAAGQTVPHAVSLDPYGQ